MTVPWLGLFGRTDSSIPAEEVAAIEAALVDAPVPAEVRVCPEAGHAFLNDTRPDLHAPSAAADGWQRTLDWFDHHLSTA